MKRFLFKLGILTVALLLAFCVVLVIAWHIPTNQGDYLAEIVVKEKLLKTTTSPRIILVGGSNLAFGIDSQTLGKLTHKHVVNMGLNAGLGLKFMLKEVEDELKPGDEVVLCPEYEHFYASGADGEQPLAQALFDYVPEKIMKLDTFQVLFLVSKYWNKEILDRLYRAGDPKLGADNLKVWFNESGDVIHHLGQPSKPGIEILPLKLPEFKPEVVKLVKDWKIQQENLGVRVLISFPPVIEAYAQSNREEIQKVQDTFRAQGIPFISLDPTALPEYDYYDTAYHLTGDARAKRTLRWAQSLVNETSPGTF